MDRKSDHKGYNNDGFVTASLNVIMPQWVCTYIYPSKFISEIHMQSRYGSSFTKRFKWQCIN